MAKYHGRIGFAMLEEKADQPGVWVEHIVEHEYFGDLVKSRRMLQSANQVNDNINISNEVSIVSDDFAFENFSSIRYLWYMGAKWKVTSIEVQYPRLILSVGGLYNGKN
jgi:hypothetical protein